MNYIETTDISGVTTAAWINQIKIRNYTITRDGTNLMISYGNRNWDTVHFSITGKNDPFFKAVRHEYYNPSKFASKAEVANFINNLFNHFNN